MSNTHQELTSPEANDFCKKLASPKQTALGKDISNSFMAGSLPKTICYKLMLVSLTKDAAVNLMLSGHNAKRNAWNEFSCSIASAVIFLATVIINTLVDDLSFHNNQYTSPALTQKVFANICRVGLGFSGVETPLFATMLVQPQPSATEEEDEVEVPNAPTPPSSTTEQPNDTSKSSLTLLNTLMETCATLSQKVSQLKQDKIAQALEILKLKRRVKKLEKKKRPKYYGLKMLRKVGTSQRVESSTKTVVGAQEDASKQGGGR
nr:hypothetical protein [Tanacetum cinerariifolium]